MKKSTMILLIIVAVLLIAAAAFCAIFLFIDTSDAPPAADTEVTTKETIHDNVEYKYNEDGQVSQILYYENDVLQGSTDYVYMDDYTCIVYFDGNNQQTGYEQTYHNALKNPTKYIKEEGDTLVESIEYDYYEDLTTLQKKTTKTYVDGVEYAEKEYYDETGKLTRKCTFENGNTISDVTYTYDADGEIVDSAPTEEGGETNAA